MKELIDRIEHDIKRAKLNRDAFEKGSGGYIFNNAIILALQGVLIDMGTRFITDSDIQ